MSWKAAAIVITIAALITGGRLALYYFDTDEDVGDDSGVHAQFELDLSPDRLADLASASVRGFKKGDLARLKDAPEAEREATLKHWHTQAAKMLAQSRFDLLLQNDGSYSAQTSLAGSKSRSRGTWEKTDDGFKLTATHSDDAVLSQPTVTEVRLTGDVLFVPWFDTDLHLKRVP